MQKTLYSAFGVVYSKSLKYYHHIDIDKAGANQFKSYLFLKSSKGIYSLVLSTTDQIITTLQESRHWFSKPTKLDLV